jgi:CheY-like chemotaxis protein
LWETCSDADQIESALLNLLVNARDAMPDGGSVTIRTANVSLWSGSQVKVPGLRDGDYVALEVADSGIGMTPEVLKRARDAFFTTKSSGKGTGLGLSTIHDFARRSGGELDIESSPGEGSIIRIYLPRHKNKAGIAASAADSAGKAELPYSHGGEMVLVVEDEEPVRRVAAATLRELGYRVIEATSAKTALDALKTAKDVRLLFTDIVMPGPTNGYQLAEEALRRCPELRVLYTSAYDGDAVAGLADARPGPLLRKPYRDYELAQAVRNAISGA